MNNDAMILLPADDPLSAIEVRALLSVALDLADDLDIGCAVVVLDGAGQLRGAERPGTVPGDQLDLAVLRAREVLGDAGGEIRGPRVGAVSLGAAGERRGALGVSGGPEGFAIAACRAAAHALGLGPGGVPAPLPG